MSGSDTLPLRVFVIIPVHNRIAFTRACLRSLQEQTRRDFDVIVVDDGSTDGTEEMVRRDFPQTLLLTGDGNLWWSRAMNMGVDCAVGKGATHIVSLNDDTLPAADFLERLLETASCLPNTLVGASMVDAYTGRLCFAGERVNWCTGGFRSLLGEGGSSSRRIVDVSHAPGRGLLIPASVFHRIGRFDSHHFPQIAADFDFTHRALRAGYRIVCDRAAVLAMYPDASGDAAIRSYKSWTNYRRHLFDINGGGNLRVFFWYAVRNCPRMLVPMFLVFGLARRVGGYLFEWAQEQWSAGEATHVRNRA